MFARLAFKQLKHKWSVNLLLFLTMTALVALYVFIFNTNRFSVRSMQLIMKRMGLKQLIVPASQSALDTYLCTEKQVTFSEQITPELARHTDMLSRYYLSMLQQKMQLSGHTLVVTGVRPVERPDETEEKGNPIKPVKPGAARLDAAAAELLEMRPGGRLAIGSRAYAVSSPWSRSRARSMTIACSLTWRICRNWSGSRGRSTPYCLSSASMSAVPWRIFTNSKEGR